MPNCVCCQQMREPRGLNIVWFFALDCIVLMLILIPMLDSFNSKNRNKIDSSKLNCVKHHIETFENPMWKNIVVQNSRQCSKLSFRSTQHASFIFGKQLTITIDTCQMQASHLGVWHRDLNLNLNFILARMLCRQRKIFILEWVLGKHGKEFAMADFESRLPTKRKTIYLPIQLR